jgi:hypothetical protein
MTKGPSEADVGRLLKHLGLWHYKLADIPIPKWSAGQYSGFAHLKQKPFDIVVIGPAGGGAIEVKSEQKAFPFMTLGGYTLNNPLVHCLGFGKDMSDWPLELESKKHGIEPHQRRGLTRMYMEGGHPYVALMLGTGPVNGKTLPRKLWIVPWMRWVGSVEIPLLTMGQASLSYDASVVKRIDIREAKLTAVDLLSEYELVWDTTLEGASKWNLNQNSKLQKSLESSFGVGLTLPQSAQRDGLIQILKGLQEPAVSPPISVPS